MSPRPATAGRNRGKPDAPASEYAPAVPRLGNCLPGTGGRVFRGHVPVRATLLFLQTKPTPMHRIRCFHLVRISTAVTILNLAGLIPACAGQAAVPASPSRPFRMGFTAFPPDITQAALDGTRQ